MAKPKKRHFLTKAKMQRDYAFYNRKYFRGKLPHAELYFSDNRNPVSLSRLPQREIAFWEADTLAEESVWKGKGLPDVHEIRFARVFRRHTGLALWRIVLLHEMIHVKHSGHGKKFQREKKRLIRAGALDNLI